MKSSPSLIWQLFTPIMLGSLVGGLAGCNTQISTGDWFTPTVLFSSSAKPVYLTLQVTPGQQPGVFNLTGKTDLPDRTELTVIAVRYLLPQEPGSRQLNAAPTYAILAYQSVAIAQGQWQTQLNLWQVAPDHRFQESWQLAEARLIPQLKPDPTVQFIVTVAPIDQLESLESLLRERGQKFAQGVLRGTSDGERYAQTHQALTLPLPTGQSAIAPSPRPEADNDGWGKRYIIPKEPPNPTQLEAPQERRTNAPARVEEFLQ
ncbi:MAG: hypothetical protein VKJ24_16535 [Synechococcales bacterium]|nr:hypothetical protein [Synechococcales bacterium]